MHSAMYEIYPEHFCRIISLFDNHIPNNPILFSVLEKKNPGRVFVDSFEDPKGAIVSAKYGSVFIGGHIEQHLLNQTIVVLAKEKKIKLVWLPMLCGNLSIPPYPHKKIPRIEFLCRDQRAITKVDDSVDDSIVIHRMDSNIVRKCLWASEVLAAHESIDGFLQHGLGFCMIKDGIIISEAYACFVGKQKAEISVISHPDFRGHSYGENICLTLIQECESLGIDAYWSCNSINKASAGLAKKLGFYSKRDYSYICFNNYNK